MQFLGSCKVDLGMSWWGIIIHPKDCECLGYIRRTGMYYYSPWLGYKCSTYSSHMSLGCFPKLTAKTLQASDTPATQPQQPTAVQRGLKTRSQGDGLEYALALRSAAVYVLGICSIPLLFPCRSAPEVPWPGLKNGLEMIGWRCP